MPRPRDESEKGMYKRKKFNVPVLEHIERVSGTKSPKAWGHGKEGMALKPCMTEH